MSELSAPRQVDTIMAPRPTESKAAFGAPQAPIQGVKKRQSRRKWILRGIIAVVLVLPFIALAAAAVVIHQSHQPALLHRTPITPVTPTTPAKTTKSN